MANSFNMFLCPGVQTVSIEEFTRDSKKEKSGEYVISYWYRGSYPHCVYAESYDMYTNTIKCINSHGFDGLITVPVEDIIRIDRIYCLLMDSDSEDDAGEQTINLARAEKIRHKLTKCFIG